ncbi:head-tail connector protein [Ligilactobacillus equi]
MSVSLETIKDSLRIDDSADDVLLTGYLNSASQFIKQAVGGDESYFEDNSRFDTAVIALASTYYTYRMTTLTGTLTVLDATMNALISQMRGEVASLEESQSKSS